MESKLETASAVIAVLGTVAGPTTEIQIAGVCFLGAIFGGFVAGQISPPAGTAVGGENRRRLWMANIAAGGVGGAFLHTWLMTMPSWSGTFEGKIFTLALGCGFTCGIGGVALLAALMPSLRKWIVTKIRNLLK